MVNIILRIVPFWSGFHLIEAALRPPRAFARGAALPVPAAIQSAGYLMTCGRGGTGRRAALRSLWPKGRGSSSLLDRTNEPVLRAEARPPPGSAKCLVRGGGRVGDLRDRDRPDRAQTDDRLVGTDHEMDAEIHRDLRRPRRIVGDADCVVAVGDALEQEEAVVVGASLGHDLARGIDDLEVDAFES